jgi:hypothetical protein
VPKKRLLLSSACLLILAAVTIFLGSIPPSPLYYLKISRETIQDFFIFGEEDKANWLLTKADKRLAEAEKLKAKNLDFFADRQIITAKNYQAESEALLTYLSDKTNTTYLKDRFSQNNDKLRLLEGN